MLGGLILALKKYSYVFLIELDKLVDGLRNVLPETGFFVVD